MSATGMSATGMSATGMFMRMHLLYISNRYIINIQDINIQDMIISYSVDTFPLVNVRFTNGIDKNNYFYNKFINYWRSLYNSKIHFYFVMDLSRLTKPDILLSYDFIQFQQKLKQNPIQYLDFSILIINNSFIRNLLNFIWKMCSPLNVVYLVDSKNKCDTLYSYIVSNNDNNTNNKLNNNNNNNTDNSLNNFILSNNIIKVIV